MSLKAKLLLDSSDYNKKMDQAKAKAAASGQDIKEKMQRAGQGFEAINKLGGATGGVMKNIQQAIAGMMSPIGLVMAGVAALGTLVVKWWDKMTQSAQQYKARMQSMSKILKDENEQLDKNKKQSDELIEILTKLNKQQTLSNAEKLLAIKIIEKLTAKYGDLGLEIDNTTGKIKNFDKANAEIARREKEKKLKALKDISDNASQQAHWQSSAMTNKIGHDWNVLGAQTFRYDTTKYKSLMQARNMGFDVQFNPTHDLQYIPGTNGSKGVWSQVEISDEEKKLRKLWNEGGIQGKMQFAKQMQGKYKGDEDTRKLFEELYNKLKEYRDANKNLKNFKAYETLDPNQIIRKINNSIDEQEKNNTETLTKVETLREQQNAKKQQNQYKSLDTDPERIQFLQKKLNKEKEAGLEIQKKANQITQKRNALAEQYQKLRKSYNPAASDEQKLKITGQMLKLQEQIKDLTGQENQLFIQQTENVGRQLQLQLAIKELKQKSADYYESSLEALEAQIQVTKLKLQGLDEEAKKQQLINELKAKGLIVDEAEVEKIMQKRKQLEKLNKDIETREKAKNYSVSGKGLYDKIQQKLNPFGYEYNKRLQEQQAKKGSALSRKQKKQIKSLVELEFKANGLMNLQTNLSGLQTLTNELASRGGFTSSVVQATSRDVNERIYQTQKSAETQLKLIVAQIRKMGVIS